MNDADLLAHGNGSDNEVDASYRDLYEGYEEEQESELRVGRIPIERSDFYVLKVTGVDARMQPFEGGSLEGTLTFTVEEGPEGMVGRFVNGRVVLGVGKKRKDESDASGKRFRLATADELAEAKKSLNATLERVKVKFGLATRFPVTGGVPGVKSWLKPAIGKVVIATAYTDDKGYSNVVNSSLRLPSDPASEKAVDPMQPKKVLPGTTALEQARAGLKAEEEKAAKKAGKAPRGKTAGAFAGSSEI